MNKLWLLIIIILLLHSLALYNLFASVDELNNKIKKIDNFNEQTLKYMDLSTVIFQTLMYKTKDLKNYNFNKTIHDKIGLLNGNIR